MRPCVCCSYLCLQRLDVCLVPAVCVDQFFKAISSNVGHSASRRRISHRDMVLVRQMAGDHIDKYSLPEDGTVPRYFAVLSICLRRTSIFSLSKLFFCLRVVFHLKFLNLDGVSEKTKHSIT